MELGVNVFFGYQAVDNIKIIQNSKKTDIFHQDVGNKQKMLVTEEEENYIENTSKGLKSKTLGDILKKLGVAIFNDNKRRDNDV